MLRRTATSRASLLPASEGVACEAGLPPGVTWMALCVWARSHSQGSVPDGAPGPRQARARGLPPQVRNLPPGDSYTASLLAGPLDAWAAGTPA